MLSRRTLLGSFGAASIAAGRSPKPNFLFILADDHAGYVLGCDGNRLARTPNLDALAQEGVRFSRHHCNSPVCTASRQSFFTGELPHSVGVTRLQTPLAADKPTLAAQFRKSGYTTAVFGKMHFNRPGVPGIHGFEIACTEDVLTREWRQHAASREVPSNVRTKPAWKPFKDPARIWLNAEKLPYPRYEADMRAAFQMTQAGQFLQAHRDTPFALWVSFLEPHSPYDFPVEYANKYAPAEFEPPQPGPEDDWQVPLIFRELTPADKRGIIASYYTSVEYLDHNVGQLLRKLRELNLHENTFVVYTADHGYHLGQHGRFEKHCGYDPALRVPLLMRFPGRAKPGVVNELTEHVDLTATIRDMMEIEPLPVEHGFTLRPCLERTATAPRDHVFAEYLENEEAYIRTARWKFVYCTGRRARRDGYVVADPTPGPYRILFDLEADPGEFRNVAERNPDVVERLEKQMIARFRKTHPDASGEDRGLTIEQSLGYYLRPRDA